MNNTSIKLSPLETFLSLPDKILKEIFCKLSYEDLLSIKDINEKFKRVVEDNYQIMKTVEALKMVIVNNSTNKIIQNKIGVYVINGASENIFFVNHDMDGTKSYGDVRILINIFEPLFRSIYLYDKVKIYDVCMDWCKKGIHLKKNFMKKYPRSDFRDFLHLERNLKFINEINIHFIYTKQPIYRIISYYTKDYKDFWRKHFLMENGKSTNGN